MKAMKGKSQEFVVYLHSLVYKFSAYARKSLFGKGANTWQKINYD